MQQTHTQETRAYHHMPAISHTQPHVTHTWLHTHAHAHRHTPLPPPLLLCVQARGSVEMWLTSVETHMRQSVRAAAKRGVREYPSAERTQWVLSNPAQLVIVVSNIFWCQAVEQCFAAADPLVALQAFYKTGLSQLAELTALVRGELTSLERKVCVGWG